MSRRRKKVQAESSGIEVPKYIVSYGAIMTILLAFFIILSTMQPVQGFDLGAKGRLDSFVKGFNAQGIMSFFKGARSPDRKPFVRSRFMDTSMRGDDPDAATYYGRTVEPNDILVRKALVETLEAGMRVTIPIPMQFGGDGTRMSRENTKALRMTADLIRDRTCGVGVECYVADAKHVPAAYLSAWDLTGRRAIEIARFLQYSCGVDGDRLEAVGGGVGAPLVPPRPDRKAPDMALIVLKPARRKLLPKVWRPGKPRVVTDQMR